MLIEDIVYGTSIFTFIVPREIESIAVDTVYGDYSNVPVEDTSRHDSSYIPVEDIKISDKVVVTDRAGKILDIDDNKVALIDADTLVYQSCSTSQALNIGNNENEVILHLAVSKAKEKIEDITKGAGCSSCILFFTGSNNFRYIVYPNYKQNRTTVHGRDLVKNELKTAYKSYDGEDTLTEADDNIIAYYSEAPDKYVLCSVDKDVYNAIEGTHYNPYSKRAYTNKKGVKIPAVEPKFIDISPLQAFKMPYFQCLVGDKTDDIIGVKGIGEAGANRLLKDLELHDDNKAIFIVLREFIKSMCSIEAYSDFEYGLKVYDIEYTPIVKDYLTAEESEHNSKAEVYEAVKMMESTMRAVNMRQVSYDFIDDSFTLNLWSFPTNEYGMFLWD